MVLVVKNLPANAGDTKDAGSNSGSRRCPWGRHGNPLQYFCLDNPHGQRSLVGYTPWYHRVRHSWSNLTHTHTQTSTSKQSMAAVNPTQKWNLKNVIDRDSVQLWKYQFSSPPRNTAAPHSLASVFSVVLQHLPSRYQMWPERKRLIMVLGRKNMIRGWEIQTLVPPSFCPAG